MNNNAMMNAMTKVNGELMVIVTGRIAQLIKDTKTDKNYNAHNLAVDALKIAREEIKNFDNVHFMPGEPNEKTGIYSIDLLPYVTCHPRCRETCGKINRGCKFNKGKCYAFRLIYRNSATCARYAINTALAIDRPDTFFADVDLLLKVSRYIRAFVSGDLNLPGFAKKFFDTIKNNPFCNVQGFSKCYEVVNDYISKYGKPDNLKLLLSGWDGMQPDNPHNLPVSDVYEEALPEGWLSCGGNCLHCACVGLGCWKAENGDVVGLKKH